MTCQIKKQGITQYLKLPKVKIIYVIRKNEFIMIKEQTERMVSARNTKCYKLKQNKIHYL